MLILFIIILIALIIFLSCLTGSLLEAWGYTIIGFVSLFFIFLIFSHLSGNKQYIYSDKEYDIAMMCEDIEYTEEVRMIPKEYNSVSWCLIRNDNKYLSKESWILVRDEKYFNKQYILKSFKKGE